MALDASRETLASLAPKSVTAPVAMGISEALGGLPSLTAVLVILTGILGAAFGPLVLDLMRIRDWRARGFAIGVASHGIGTSRAVQVSHASPRSAACTARKCIHVSQVGAVRQDVEKQQRELAELRQAGTADTVMDDAAEYSPSDSEDDEPAAGK